MFEGDEIGGSVVGAHAAFVVAENHVHDPMSVVFDHAMPADHDVDLWRRQAQRSEVEMHLVIDFVANLARAFDDDDVFQTGPIVAFP